MAISITQTSQGNDWVQVRVSGLDSNYPIKSLEYYINGSYEDSYDTHSGGSTVQFVIENLSPNTSYTLQVRAFAYYTVGGLTDWWPDPNSDGNVASVTISTAGSSSAYFTAYGNSDSIDIEVTNLSISNYDTIYYELYETASSSTTIYSWNGLSTSHTFSNLSSGTYYVEVWYVLNNNWTQLESDNYNTREPVMVSGGGGESPYYTYSVTDTSVTITIHNIGSGYYYSFWIKDANDSTTIYDTENYSSRVTTNPFTIPVTLSPNTTYLIKQVDYSTQSSGSASSLTPIEYSYYGSGNQSTTFTTSGSGPTPSGGGKVHIFNGSRWVSAKPYIFNGSSWVPASPYIFDGSQWRPCT